MRYSTHHYAQALFESLDGKKGKTRTEIIGNFLKLVHKNNEYRRLDGILRSYEKIYLRKNGLVKVHIESVEKASENLKRSIEKALGKPVVFSERENPRLLAGLVLLVNDSTLIDASVLSRLEILRATH